MTQSSVITDIGALALIWLACWGVSFGLIRKGVTYPDHPAVTSALFLGFSVPVVVLHWRRLEPLAGQLTAAPCIALALAVALTSRRCGRVEASAAPMMSPLVTSGRNSPSQVRRRRPIAICNRS